MALEASPALLKTAAWQAFVIVMTLGGYDYVSRAPLRKLAALCATIERGADAQDLRGLAIAHGIEDRDMRWSGQTLTITVHTGMRNYPSSCAIQTQNGKVSAVSPP